MKKVVIIGGGPSGMMAAITASDNNKVILLDKNEKLGKKLFITGKGRCNVTNAKDISDFFEYIPTNPNFLYSALYTFTNENTIDFFNSRGVKLKTERGDRIFPQSDKSSDIIKALEKELKSKGVEIKLNSNVEKIFIENKQIDYIKLRSGEIIKGDVYILCTGGCSYPQTGSNGEGYKIARSVGHSIIEPKPALIPIEFKEQWVKELQGLSLRNVEFSIINENKKVLYENFGEMLFTHFGVSGPIVLSGSRFINNKTNLKAVINLKPALNFQELDNRVQKDFKKYCNKDFKNSLQDLLPKKIISTIIRLSNVDENKKVNLITKEERKRLVRVIQNLTFSIKGTRPIAEAIVTVGGINTKEIDPSTMKSKIIENLSFAGEVIDVDANTGGYNIQIALSTGFLAGSNI
ncbi:NAD(P)/FAD-dependent oxidoreductase [Haloimpatiens sp. FM7330]|uniref:NAD(P)/FAD-dependent oxidoreductase n=1 Tax=Haloimpatiens sp. FM7330 TaxID=3298610 RepID=UPI00362945E3